MNLEDVITVTKPTFPDATDADIASAFGAIDTAALTAAEEPLWTHETWNRKTPINGVSAADVLAKRNDIPDTGKVVIVKRDGNIVMFQPHDPNQPGFAPIVDGAATGTQMTAKAVTEAVDSQTLQLVATAIQNLT